MKLFVDGLPKGQPRPKARAFKGHAQVYDPGSAYEWKVAVREAVKGLPMLDGPLDVSLSFNMPRPKAHYRTGKFRGQVKDNAPDWHTSKPDVDNLAKAVLDACTGLLWEDDTQIARLMAAKIYSLNPGVAIEVVPVSPLILEEFK